MQHFVFEINVSAITLTENAGVIFIKDGISINR